MPLEIIVVPLVTAGGGKVLSVKVVGITVLVPADTTPASSVPALKRKLPDVGSYATHVVPSHCHDVLFAVNTWFTDGLDGKSIAAMIRQTLRC